MITKQQYIKIKGLEREKERLNDLLGSFGRLHVWSKVGIVEINGAALNSPRGSEHAEYFHRHFETLRERFEEILIEDIKDKIKAIDSEIGLYIDKGDA